ncbi:MAG TPA: LemA family protein [Patescibacteria group bacterium]|nr:LemA family protein [Patescibacteria group bacterium]
MSPNTIKALGVVAVVLLVGLWGYSLVVSSRNNYDNTVGNVQNAYQFRFDTIPNFVSTAKFSVEKQEEFTNENSRIREGLTTATGLDADKLADQYRNLLVNVRAEANVTLKTDQLTELNSEIDSANRVVRNQRDIMNGACRSYRNAVQLPPGAFVAWITGFDSSYCTMFKADPEAQKAPKVDFTH